MSFRIEDLRPDVQVMANAFIEDLRDRSVAFFVHFTKRTDDEQVALWTQGRAPLDVVNLLRKKAGLRLISAAENTYIVTQCDGVNVRSPHQDGRALDVVPMEEGNPKWPPPSDPRWEEIAKSGEKFGFIWGGRWSKFPDFPHYETV